MCSNTIPAILEPQPPRVHGHDLGMARQGHNFAMIPVAASAKSTKKARYFLYRQAMRFQASWMPISPNIPRQRSYVLLAKHVDVLADR